MRNKYSRVGIDDIGIQLTFLCPSLLARMIMARFTSSVIEQNILKILYTKNNIQPEKQKQDKKTFRLSAKYKTGSNSKRYSYASHVPFWV